MSSRAKHRSLSLSYARCQTEVLELVPELNCIAVVMAAVVAVVLVMTVVAVLFLCTLGIVVVSSGNGGDGQKQSC